MQTLCKENCSCAVLGRSWPGYFRSRSSRAASEHRQHASATSEAELGVTLERVVHVLNATPGRAGPTSAVWLFPTWEAPDRPPRTKKERLKPLHRRRPTVKRNSPPVDRGARFDPAGEFQSVSGPDAASRSPADRIINVVMS
ncbi:unnamed protein product [Lota lota]